MSTTIKLRRSAVPGRVPTVEQLELGEIAINTADGKLYFKRFNPVANTESIIDVSADLDAAAILDLLKTVDGPGSGLDADTLDGQTGDYYLDYNNFTNVPPATFDLTLDGKVTGTAFSNTGIMTLTTELANTGVVPGSYGSASLVPIITVDEDGRITNASTVSVAGVSNTFWTVANTTFTIETADGGIYNTVINNFNDAFVNNLATNNIDTQDLVSNTANISTLIANAVDIETQTSNNVTITTDLTVGNNIIVGGLVDGRDIAADGAKLDNLEDGLDLTLVGKVTGTASSNTGVMTLTTELANTGVIAGTYGSATAIPIITIDEDGRITLASTSSVSGVENFAWTSANNTLVLETGDGTNYNVLIDTFSDITTGNITTTGTVDGRDLSVDGLKLDGIEDGATADQTPAEILTALLTVDGDASGLDADKLDGYDAGALLDEAANNAASLIGNGRIDVLTGNGLDGSGFFNLNDANNTVITLSHTDTSSVIDSVNTGSNVLQSITFDTFGHVQTISSTDLDNRYYTETELNNGVLDTRYYTETELNNGQLDNRYYTESELDSGQLDNRYYTESEADAKFVDVTGDTMTGDLTVQGNFSLNHSTLISSTSTTTTTSAATIYAFPWALYAGAEIIISMTRGSDKHLTKLLITHDGSVAIATEFGTVYTNTELADFEIDLIGPVVTVQATPNSATSTIFKIAGTLIKT